VRSILKDKRYKKLKDFFYWSVRRTFQDLQIQNQAVAEYLTGLLVYFCRTEMLYSLRNAQNKKLETVVDMLLEVSQAKEEEENTSQKRAREIYQHLGDYIMFITGIFQEYVIKLGCLDFYLRKGEIAYRYLFEYDLKHYIPGASLFLELSRRFEFYSGALHYMRKTFFRDPEPNDPFLDFSRQLAKSF
jgi:hypothetical protein